MNERARARRSSSATTYAGVPNSRASSTASHPPISSRPRSLTREPSGYTCDSVAAVTDMAGRSCHAQTRAWHDRRVPRPRTVTPQLPSEIGVHDGLAYSLWLPAGGPPPPAWSSLHGAGSCKENHHDFARAALGAGLAAIAFDQRGHGDSEGPIDGRAIDDVVAMADAARKARTAAIPSRRSR